MRPQAAVHETYGPSLLEAIGEGDAADQLAVGRTDDAHELVAMGFNERARWKGNRMIKCCRWPGRRIVAKRCDVFRQYRPDVTVMDLRLPNPAGSKRFWNQGHARVTTFGVPARVQLGDQLVTKHVTISPDEAADRLAIQDLVETCAHCADRRDAKGQMALFTPDAHFVVYMNAKDPRPTQELHSREALAPVFADLNQYAATTHFVGQSTIFTLTGDRATGETYCLAHQLTIDGENDA